MFEVTWLIRNHLRQNICVDSQDFFFAAAAIIIIDFMFEQKLRFNVP